MSNNTTYSTVVFGKKASSYSTDTRPYSTSARTDEISLKKSFSFGTYKTVDYSDRKKMETYRKVNKMLGGK